MSAGARGSHRSREPSCDLRHDVHRDGGAARPAEAFSLVFGALAEGKYLEVSDPTKHQVRDGSEGTE
jgi:hypothetical protein